LEFGYRKLTRVSDFSISFLPAGFNLLLTVQKKAPQIIDLQGLISGGGEGAPIEHLTSFLALIQRLKY